MKQIAFIISLPRSGSTLLQKLLHNHPEIATSAENWILLSMCYALFEKDMLAPYNHRLAMTAMRDLQDRAGIDLDLQVNEFATRVFDQMCRPGQTFVDKTPRNYLIIEHLMRVFPNAKFIVLKRNPIQVYASILSSWRNNRFRGHYRDWIDVHVGPRRIATTLKLLRNRAHVVDYENLVRSPNEVLLGVQEYLAIKPVSDLHEMFDPSLRLGVLGDQKGHRFADVNNSSVDSWRGVFATHLRKRYIRRYVMELARDGTLQDLGYERDELIEEIDKIQAGWEHTLVDIWDINVSHLVRRWNLNVLLKPDYSSRFYT